MNDQTGRSDHAAGVDALPRPVTLAGGCGGGGGEQGDLDRGRAAAAAERGESDGGGRRKETGSRL